MLKAGLRKAKFHVDFLLIFKIYADLFYFFLDMDDLYSSFSHLRESSKHY